MQQPESLAFCHGSQELRQRRSRCHLNTGEYIYREAPCPDGDKGCEGSPYNDTQDTWIADWFKPAETMFQAAPFVFLRGNHEICTRAGDGWFRYLYQLEQPEECQDYIDPIVTNFQFFQIGMMDTTAQAEDVSIYAGQLESLDKAFAKRSGKRAWIASHYPFYGWGTDDDDVTGNETITPAKFLQDAVAEAGGLSEQTRLIVSAHIHLAELVVFKGGNKDGFRPPQLVVANGGTQLVAPPPEVPVEIDGVKVRDTVILYQYGFVVMKNMGSNAKSWSVWFKDIAGRTLERCSLVGKRASCDSTLGMES